MELLLMLLLTLIFVVLVCEVARDVRDEW